MIKGVISIIIPAYNSEKSIGRTVESILDQSYKDLEIIIVNDASSDNTLKLIKSLSGCDHRIVIIDLEENVGVHEARMQGLRKSKGKWIGFVDADDYVNPDMYQVLLNDIIDNNADISLCSVERVNEAGVRLGLVPKFRKSQIVESDLLEKLTDLKFGPPYLCNKLYSREIIIDLADKPFPWRQSLNEDLVINIGCFLKAKRVVLNEHVFYSYVDNPKSATSSNNNEKNYIEHVKAFAIALHLYRNESSFVKEKIFDIFREQITYPSMHIDETLKLDKYKKDLLEAVDLVCLYDPLSIIKLASRNNKANHLGKSTLYKIVKRSIDKYVTKKGLYEFVR